MKKLLVITDMSFEGSGYLNISTSLFTELAQNYNIMIVGFGYEGQEHWHPFSILPCKDMSDLTSIVHNLIVMEQTTPDAIVVALDIPQQIQMHSQFSKYGKPYIAITPLENPPLTMEWSAKLMQMSYVFFISELGEKTARNSGLSNVGHLQIGINQQAWRPRTNDERLALRKGMDIADDEYVILTVAENQERKNLSAALAITCELKRRGVKVRHILVTRVKTAYGWDLRDLAFRLGINNEVMLMNKGMPQENLRGLYAMADCFLLTSKAEGLGMPVLESMSVGLPVVGTDTGAIHELLQDGRGSLIPAEYSFTDVWGNSKRDMISIEKATDKIESFAKVVNPVTEPASEYAKSRTWDIPAKQLTEKIEELTNVKKA